MVQAGGRSCEHQLLAWAQKKDQINKNVIRHSEKEMILRKSSLCVTVSDWENTHQTVSWCGRPLLEHYRFSPGSSSRHTLSFCDEDKRMCNLSEWESGTAWVVAIFVLHSLENVTANLFYRCEVTRGWTATTTTTHHKLICIRAVDQYEANVISIIIRKYLFPNKYCADKHCRATTHHSSTFHHMYRKKKKGGQMAERNPALVLHRGGSHRNCTERSNTTTSTKLFQTQE